RAEHPQDHLRRYVESSRAALRQRQPGEHPEHERHQDLQVERRAPVPESWCLRRFLLGTVRSGSFSFFGATREGPKTSDTVLSTPSNWATRWVFVLISPVLRWGHRRGLREARILGREPSAEHRRGWPAHYPPAALPSRPSRAATAFA